MIHLDLPKITVITPSYNQAAFLEQTITSVVEQNYPNLEYIILDGGSTDDSVRIIKRYENFLTYWRSFSDGGQASAIAEGFSRATGEILCWLNSDDFLAPKSLFTVANFFNENSGVDFLVGEVCIVSEDGTPKTYICEPQWNLNWQIYIRNCIPQSSTFWRRSLYEKISGINENYEFDMDYDLWYQFLQHTEPYYLNKLLSFQRNHLLTKTSTMKSVMMAERPQILECYFPEVIFPSRSKYVIWKLHRILVKTFLGSYFTGLLKLYKTKANILKVNAGYS